MKHSELSKGEALLAYKLRSYVKLYDACDGCDEMMPQ